MDYADAHGIKYDKVVLLQPTSPLRTVEDVESCLSLYSLDIDMVVSVVEASANPYYNCFEGNPETGICKYVRETDITLDAKMPHKCGNIMAQFM